MCSRSKIHWYIISETTSYTATTSTTTAMSSRIVAMGSVITLLVALVLCAVSIQIRHLWLWLVMTVMVMNIRFVVIRLMMVVRIMKLWRVMGLLLCGNCHCLPLLKFFFASCILLPIVVPVVRKVELKSLNLMFLFPCPVFLRNSHKIIPGFHLIVDAHVQTITLVLRERKNGWLESYFGINLLFLSIRWVTNRLVHASSYGSFTGDA